MPAACRAGGGRSPLTNEEKRRCDCCGMLAGVAELLRKEWITPAEAADSIADLIRKCDPWPN